MIVYWPPPPADSSRTASSRIARSVSILSMRAPRADWPIQIASRPWRRAWSAALRVKEALPLFFHDILVFGRRHTPECRRLELPDDLVGDLP